MSAHRRRVLVAGIGNPLAGDDGIGEVVARTLAADPLPPGVEVRYPGTDPLAVLTWLGEGFRVLVIDACRHGGLPGEAVLFRLDEPDWRGREAPLSLHGIDLEAAARIGRELGVPLGNALVVGIEPARVEPGTGLSRELLAAIPRLVELARQATWALLRDEAEVNR